MAGLNSLAGRIWPADRRWPTSVLALAVNNWVVWRLKSRSGQNRWPVKVTASYLAAGPSGSWLVRRLKSNAPGQRVVFRQFKRPLSTCSPVSEEKSSKSIVAFQHDKRQNEGEEVGACQSFRRSPEGRWCPTARGRTTGAEGWRWAHLRPFWGSKRQWHSCSAITIDATFAFIVLRGNIRMQR